jgi:pimeloyl-ACP methyl ester carboxylesterase
VPCRAWHATVSRSAYCDIITPTLIVTGVHDTLAPRAWVEQMVQMIPNARAIIIHRSPHAFPYSAPQQLVRVMQPFLRRTWTTSTKITG